MFCAANEIKFSYGGTLGIRRVRNVTRLVWKIASSDDGRDYRGKRGMSSWAVWGQNEFFDSHKQWWKNYWERAVCAFLINGKTGRYMTNLIHSLYIQKRPSRVYGQPMKEKLFLRGRGIIITI